MANVTISPAAFPAGVTVSLRPRSLKNEDSARRTSGPHKVEGAAVASGTMLATGLTLAGATSGQWYWATATVDGQPRWVAVLCP